MPLPRWVGKERKQQNSRSQKQERDHAKRVGGRVQAGSGSSPRARGDVKTDTYLDELKYTDKLTYTVDVRRWKEHCRRALDLGKEPRMFVEFSKYGVTIQVVEPE